MSYQAAKNILPLYHNHSDLFIKSRSRSLFERSWLDKFIAALNEGNKILDIGCGTGKPIAEYFIKKGFSLTGIDGAASMLNHAKQDFPEHTWILQDMRKLNINHTYDGIIAWDSFFHLTQEDQINMFPTFASHSHKGSVLMFTSGTSNGIAMGEFAGEPLFHASLAPDEYNKLLAENGFTVLEMIQNDPLCTGHTIWFSIKKI
ncbi:TPA: class I SAM-dependent methyltransferase [Providencia rettgeri]